VGMRRSQHTPPLIRGRICDGLGFLGIEQQVSRSCDRRRGAADPLHLNGYKIANPTLLARITREELVFAIVLKLLLQPAFRILERLHVPRTIASGSRYGVGAQIASTCDVGGHAAASRVKERQRQSRSSKRY
jgi:hypothetical protein